MTRSTMSITLASVCVALLATGCGQTLSIRVERIKTIDGKDFKLDRFNDPREDLTNARVALSQVATLTIDMLMEIDRYAAGNLPGVSEDLTQAKAAASNAVHADRQMTGPEIRLRLEEELQRLMRARQFLLNLMNPTFANALGITDDQQKHFQDVLLPRAAERIRLARALVNKAESELKRIYGGFISETVYLINPGSGAYRELRAGGTTSELVFNKVEAIATGDSVLLAVQESPAYFTMRYVSGDPTEVIRNTMLIANRVLRVAASFVPMIGGVAEAVGTAPVAQAPGGAAEEAQPAAPMTLAAAEAAMDDFESRLRSLVEDAEFRELLRQLRENPTTQPAGADLGRLLEKLSTLEAIVGPE